MKQHVPQFDAVVVGLGFAGIYMLHKLRNELGLKVRGFDRGEDVGGTWHWNRYPGARSDTESFVYRYSFEEETCSEWDWGSRYASQPVMQAYLRAVAQRNRLLADIQLNTTIDSLIYDESHDLWTVATSTGEFFTARYVITAVGVLSKINIPVVPDAERFQGQVVHTGAWPRDLSLVGKRVGVIGTGSTGVQLIPAAAQSALHLTVFQRSAQYCVPAGDDRVSETFAADYRENFEQFWNALRSTRIACGFDESETPAMGVSEEERERVFERHWELGNGFRFMFGTFNDIVVDLAANQAAADFIRRKIHAIVEDPETARKLTPTQLFAKRPVCTNGYYETFNRPHVSLVNLPENPITGMTPYGVVTRDGREHPLDVLVYATGFETIEGSYNEMNIVGRGGKTLSDHWKNRPASYLGVAAAGFPNMLMILGPNSAFSNLPPSIETQVDWIAGLIKDAQKKSRIVIETTQAAEDGWTALCTEIAGYTLFPQVKSWIFGENIPGKQARVLFYFGGLAAYREKLAEVADAGYEGFVMRTTRVESSPAPEPISVLPI